MQPVNDGLSLRTQCRLIAVARSSCYYEPAGESVQNLKLMKRIDQIHLDEPTYGIARMTVTLRKEGNQIKS